MCIPFLDEVQVPSTPVSQLQCLYSFHYWSHLSDGQRILSNVSTEDIFSRNM